MQTKLLKKYIRNILYLNTFDGGEWLLYINNN